MKVKLTYFKRSGKYYTKAVYESGCEYAFNIFSEVRDMRNEGQLPGLVSNHSDFIVLVEPFETAPGVIL
jgi:hypothetical protein